MESMVYQVVFLWFIKFFCFTLKSLILYLLSLALVIPQSSRLGDLDARSDSAMYWFVNDLQNSAFY